MYKGHLSLAIGPVMQEKILSEPTKQRNNRKIAWILAGIAIAWYLISMFTIWK
jgi:hypothetical protein